ncbi:MAG: hypothetical protein HY692_09150 [Cyanobacteria bacterium NC_groundwater_1444_Ag_S-0.65um_54_12]|nr:hypothetical protein [Cyanobacteria bacterium NC_groundwater_1444_Ag_S-0.65um_54_12]
MWQRLAWTLAFLLVGCTGSVKFDSVEFRPAPADKNLTVGKQDFSARVRYTVSGLGAWGGTVEVTAIQDASPVVPALRLERASVPLMLQPAKNRDLTLKSSWKLKMGEEQATSSFELHYKIFDGAGELLTDIATTYTIAQP